MLFNIKSPAAIFYRNGSRKNISFFSILLTILLLISSAGCRTKELSVPPTSHSLSDDEETDTAEDARVPLQSFPDSFSTQLPPAATITKSGETTAALTMSEETTTAASTTAASTAPRTDSTEQTIVHTTPPQTTTAAKSTAAVTTTTTYIPIMSFKISHTVLDLELSSGLKMGTTISPASATDKRIYWSSSDSSVATVSEDGLVMSVGEGTCVITARTNDGFVSECITTVTVKIKQIFISHNRDLYQTGETGKISLRFHPEGSEKNPYIITSDNPSVMEITETGSYICHSSGSAVLTIRSDNGVSASRAITVANFDALVAEALRLTNIERTKHGLAELTADVSLGAAAKLRAAETVTVFTHARPDGRSCFTAIREAGFDYKKAAENIAYGQATSQAVIDGWMNSEDHRKNILNPDLTHIGIGVNMDSDGRLYWAQLFAAAS